MLLDPDLELAICPKIPDASSRKNVSGSHSRPCRSYFKLQACFAFCLKVSSLLSLFCCTGSMHILFVGHYKHPKSEELMWFGCCLCSRSPPPRTGTGSEPVCSDWIRKNYTFKLTAVKDAVIKWGFLWKCEGRLWSVLISWSISPESLYLLIVELSFLFYFIFFFTFKLQ